MGENPHISEIIKSGQSIDVNINTTQGPVEMAIISDYISSLLKIFISNEYRFSIKHRGFGVINIKAKPIN